ncbi:MAG: heme-copper oxidase subunit III [Anaerolineales bacterium]|nr:heme-copper oxidase subunit III [Anaerolineales bacterium]
MSTHIETKHESLADYKIRENRNRLALWLFVISELFLFGGIMVARVVLWDDTRPHLEQGPAFVLTAALLLSSFFMNRAELGMKFGDQKTFERGILATIALGTLFLVGVLAVEWPLSGLRASEDVYGAVFFLMTGMHAFHVLTGVIFLGLVYRNGKKGLYSPEKHWAVEAAAIYWHFVDVVWIFFYPALYLIGKVV